jgi:hypothetical protein
LLSYIGLGDLPDIHIPERPELILIAHAQHLLEGMAARRAASSVLSRFLLTRTSPSPASAGSSAGKSPLLGAGDDLFMNPVSFLIHFC